MAFIFDANTETPESVARRRQVADALAARIFSNAPQNLGQGIASIGQALIARQMASEADEAAKAGRQSADAAFAPILGGGAAPSVAPAAAPAAAPSTAPVAVPPGRDGFVASITPAVEEAAKRTGIDPRIITAQAALESGWGKSAPGNNYFGIKGPGNTMPTTEVVNGQPVRTSDSFRAYASPADSVAGYSDLMMGNRYAPVRTAQGLDAQAAALGQSGYATDPAYGQKILQIARSLPAPAAPAAAAPAAPVQMAQAGDPAAIPANAQPTQGYAVPGQPAAQPQLSTRALIAAASNPWLSKGQQTVVNTLLERQLNQDKVSTIDLGNSVGVMDARGNIVRSIPKGEPNKGPEYGVIGKDEFGNEQYGWRDPRTQTVTPFKAPGPTDSQPSAIPAAPKGIDPKLWREEQSKRAVSEALPADTKVTSQLRQEIQALPSYKNIAQAAPVYKSMIEAAGRDNRAADVNLIYGMAKIMDPGSVVREGEMSIASAIATLPQRLQATVQSQLTGDGRLSPEVRTAIIQEARGRVGAYQSMFDQDMGMYRGIAQRGRMDERDVIPTFGPFETYKPSTPATPTAVAPSAPPQQPAPAVDPAALAEARRRGLIK